MTYCCNALHLGDRQAEEHPIISNWAMMVFGVTIHVGRMLLLWFECDKHWCIQTWLSSIGLSRYQDRNTTIPDFPWQTGKHKANVTLWSFKKVTVCKMLHAVAWKINVILGDIKILFLILYAMMLNKYFFTNKETNPYHISEKQLMFQSSMCSRKNSVLQTFP